MTPIRIGELAAVGTAVCWTYSAVAWTTSGKFIGAIPVSFIRLILSCIPFMVFNCWISGSPLPIGADARTWELLISSGLVGFFVSDICIFKSFLLVGPRIALLVQALTPPSAALLTWGLYHQRLSDKNWLAMGITLAGIIWVVLEQPPSDVELHSAGHRGLGVLLAALAAIGQSVSFVLAREGMRDYHSAVSAAFIRILASIVGYLVLLTVLGRWGTIRIAIQNRKAMTIVTSGAMVGSFIGVIFNMRALANCTAGVVATILATMPVMILPFTIFLFKEKVSLRAAGGAVLSLVGIALLMYGT